MLIVNLVFLIIAEKGILDTMASGIILDFKGYIQ
jgi:hypothetical protein